MLHDPTLYPDPDTFKPERFINTDGSLRDDPNLTSAFGFGKRICPGRHVVDAILFSMTASLLAAFNIKRGEGGGSKPSDYTFTGSISR
jgi:cytochrome P450